MTTEHYYSLSEAIEMWPLILSYCKSIKVAMAQEKKRVKLKKILESLVSLNPAKQEKIKRILKLIQLRDELIIIYANRWKEELDKMSWCVCSPTNGIIDVPVWDDTTEQVMYLCVQANINKNNLFWHLPEECHLNCRPCWGVTEKQAKHKAKVPRIRY